MMALFETHDVDVLYVYDRAHEGMNDEYNASVPKLKCSFCFSIIRPLPGQHTKVRLSANFSRRSCCRKGRRSLARRVITWQ